MLSVIVSIREESRLVQATVNGSGIIPLHESNLKRNDGAARLETFVSHSRGLVRFVDDVRSSHPSHGVVDDDFGWHSSSTAGRTSCRAHVLQDRLKPRARSARMACEPRRESVLADSSSTPSMSKSF